MVEPKTLEPLPHSAALDEFLREVVATLQSAVDQGIKTGEDDPKTTDKVIHDCEDMIGVIMAGHVEEWIQA
jgi:hypothetical protein